MLDESTMNGGRHNARALWRRRLRTVLTACALSCVLAGPAAAVTFPDLYTVTVPADEEARDQRAAAIEQGMSVLLTRVTGRRQAGAYPELAELVDGAERRLTSYAVLNDEEIRVGFNANAVNDFLTSLNWPIWGSERPLTALWVAIDLGNGQRIVLSADETAGELEPDLQEFVDGIREEILRAADERGLPVVLPLLDAQDFQVVSFAAIWGGFDPLIERASSRYGADAALVARIAITELGLDVRWSAIRGGRSQTLQSSALREGIDWLADQYAAQYSAVGGARTTRITIVDVGDFDTYARVMSHLETLSVLQSIDVEEFSDDVLTLRIASRGDDSVLQRVLTLGDVLEPSDAATSSLDFGSPLIFRVVKGSDSGP